MPSDNANEIIDFNDKHLQKEFKRQMKDILYLIKTNDSIQANENSNISSRSDFIQDLLRIKILFHPSNIGKLQWVFNYLESKLLVFANQRNLLDSNSKLKNPNKHYKILSDYLYNIWGKEKGFNQGVMQEISGINFLSFPSDTGILMEEVKPEIFLFLIKNGYLLNDKGNGDDFHGEFTHALQWYLIITYNEKYHFLHNDPLWIYKQLGEKKYSNFKYICENEIVLTSLWDYVFDITDDDRRRPSLSSKHGFSCFNFLHKFVRENKQCDLLSTLISTRSVKREEQLKDPALDYKNRPGFNERYHMFSESTFWKKIAINDMYNFNNQQLMQKLGEVVELTILKNKSIMKELIMFAYIFSNQYIASPFKVTALKAALLNHDLKEMISIAIESSNPRLDPYIINQINLLAKPQPTDNISVNSFIDNFIKITENSKINDEPWQVFLAKMVNYLNEALLTHPQYESLLRSYISVIGDTKRSIFDRVYAVIRPFFALDIKDIVENIIIKNYPPDNAENILSHINILMHNSTFFECYERELADLSSTNENKPRF